MKKSSHIVTYLSSSKPSKYGGQDMLDIVGVVRRNLQARLFYGLLLMDISVLADQKKHLFIRYIETLDAIERTCQDRWSMGTDGERELRKSVMSARHDGDSNQFH